MNNLSYYWIVFSNIILMFGFTYSKNTLIGKNTYIKYVFLISVTLLYWKIYENNKNYYFILTEFLIIIAIYFLVINLKKISINDYFRENNNFITLFIIYNFVIFIYSYFIDFKGIPVFIDGNNDIWLYSKYATILTEYKFGNNIVGLNLREILPNTQTPLAFLLIGAVSKIMGLSVTNSLYISILIPVAASALFVYHIAEKNFNFDRIEATLISLTWATSGFLVYILKNYFLGQILGITFFLLGCIIVNSNISRFKKSIIMAVIWYFIFLSYQLFTVVYIILIGASLLTLYFYKSYLFRENIKDFLVSYSLSLVVFAIAVLAVNSTLVITVLSRMAELNNAAAGWPMPFIKMTSILPIPLYGLGLASDKQLLNMAGVFFISLLMLYASIKHRFRSEIFYVLLFCMAVLAYFLYFFLKGVSYQQWKFAGSVLIPLTFLPLVALLKVLNRKFSILIISIILTCNIVAINFNKNQNDMYRYSGLMELVELDNSFNIKNIVVNLPDDYVGTMIAQQYINKKNLYILSPSYLTGFVSANKSLYELVDNPIYSETFYLLNNCDAFKLANQTRFSQYYCGTYGKPEIRDNFSITFNVPLPYFIKASGLSAVEPWGRWIDGDSLILDFENLVPLAHYNIKLALGAVTEGGGCRQLDFMAAGYASFRKCIGARDSVELLITSDKFGRASFKVVDLGQRVSRSGEDQRDMRFSIISMKVFKN